VIDPLAMLGNLHGVEVQVNDLLEDTPKLRFVNQPDSPVVREINDWLAKTFGYNHPYYWIGQRTIVTNKSGYEHLIRLTRSNKRG
jgi:hypothetical protein